MSHLKRYAMPQWPLSRKERVFVVAPRPGPHKKMECIPLLVVIRDVLKHTETNSEAMQIISARKVLVDKKTRTDPNFPVGFMDVVEIPETGEAYRVMFAEKGLKLETIGQQETDRKFCRIEGKTTIRKGMTQLRLHDGRSILAERKNDYRLGDTLLIHLPDQAVMKHYRLEKNAGGMVIAGKNTGITGIIKEIKTRKSMLEKSTITLKADAREIETLKGYVMPLDMQEMGKIHHAPSAEPAKENGKRKTKPKKTEKEADTE